MTAFGCGQAATATERRVVCIGQDVRMNKTWTADNEIMKELMGRHPGP